MKYFLDQDNSFHWYIIPDENRKQWEEWKEIPEENELAWTAPAFSKIINGPSDVVFENPLMPSAGVKRGRKKE